MATLLYYIKMNKLFPTGLSGSSLPTVAFAIVNFFDCPFLGIAASRPARMTCTQSRRSQPPVPSQHGFPLPGSTLN